MKRQPAKGGKGGAGRRHASASRSLRAAGQRSASGSGTLGQKSASGSGTLSGRKKASGSGTLKHPAPHQAKASAALKHPSKGKAPAARKWSPGADVACCSAEALGTLLGWDWEQILALYWSTAGHPDAGASILATLEASYSAFAERSPLDLLSPASGLILGVTLPEPHAVAVTPDGTWWSWGEPFDPAAWPDLIIDEAWAVVL